MWFHVCFLEMASMGIAVVMRPIKDLHDSVLLSGSVLCGSLDQEPILLALPHLPL